MVQLWKSCASIFKKLCILPPCNNLQQTKSTINHLYSQLWEFVPKEVHFENGRLKLSNQLEHSPAATLKRFLNPDWCSSTPVWDHKLILSCSSLQGTRYLSWKGDFVIADWQLTSASLHVGSRPEAVCNCPALGCLQLGAACSCPALVQSWSYLGHTPVLVAQQRYQQCHQSLECRQLDLACFQMHLLTPCGLLLHHLMIPLPTQIRSCWATKPAS